MADKTAEELADDYIQSLSDNDHVIEWREGTNSGRHLTPKEMRDLIDLKNRADSDSERKARGGVLKRVVD